MFFATGDRRIVRLSLDKGGKQWSWRAGADIAASPVVAGGLVLVAGFEAVLWAYHASSGELAWRAALPSRPVGSPVVTDGAVLVSCLESELLGFDLRTGKGVGGARLPVEMRAAPLLVDRRVIVPTARPDAHCPRPDVAGATGWPRRSLTFQGETL